MTHAKKAKLAHLDEDFARYLARFFPGRTFGYHLGIHEAAHLVALRELYSSDLPDDQIEETATRISAFAAGYQYPGDLEALKEKALEAKRNRQRRASPPNTYQLKS